MMRPRRSIPVVLVGLACWTSVQAYSFDREIEVRPGGTLVVDLETGGNIEIVGWDRDALSVNAEFHGRDAESIELVLDERGDVVELRSAYVEKRSRHSSGGKVEIKLPRRFDVDVHTSGGDVRVEGVEGTIEGDTMGGELGVSGVRGHIELTTMGGNIDVRDSEADGKVETYGGNVHLENVVGNLRANTLGGNVTFDNVRPGGGGSDDGDEVRISTHGGNIRVPDAPYGADVQTLGGNIRVQSAGDHVKAKTLGGNIVIDAVDGWVKATTMGGRIEVVMIGDPRSGRRDARLLSNGGDVTLTVPDGTSMEIDITLAYTKNSRREFAIESDFPVETRRSQNWEHDQGTPRKYLRARGSVGDGKHRIRIETINGDVRLLRGD